MQSDVVDVDDASTATLPICVDEEAPVEPESSAVCNGQAPPGQKELSTSREDEPPSASIPNASSSPVLFDTVSSASLGESPLSRINLISTTAAPTPTVTCCPKENIATPVSHEKRAPALVPIVVHRDPTRCPTSPAKEENEERGHGEAADAVAVEEASGLVDTAMALRAFVASWAASSGGIRAGMLVFAPHRFDTIAISHAPTAAAPHVSTSSPTTPAAAAAAMANGVLPAPVRLHYALAEVTGLQSSAGTATVSFLMTDPGVDDEAIPLFELIPCPATWLSRLGVDAVSARHGYCSLLERVLDVTPADGPVHADAAFAHLAAVAKGQAHQDSTGTIRPLFELEEIYCLAKDNGQSGMPNSAGRAVSRDGAGPNEAQSWVPARKAAKLEAEPWARRGRGRAAAEDLDAAHAGLDASTLSRRYRVSKDKDVLSFTFEAPQSVHTFFATAFHEMDDAVEAQRELWRTQQAKQEAPATGPAAQMSEKAMRRTLWQPRKPLVILCLFDGYSVLHRFEVYMSLRGHVVRLLDGEEVQAEGWMANAEDTPASSSGAGDGGVARKVCLGPTPVPPVAVAFSSECKVWLCMLRDDATADGAVGSGSPSLPRLLSQAPPIDLVISLREVDEQAVATAAAREASVAVAPDGPREEEVRLARAVADKDGADAAVHRLLPHLQASRGRHLYCCFDHLPLEHGAAGKVVKVSGSLFGANKLLVPASRHQLLLAATVWASAGHAAAAAATASGGLAPSTLASGRGSGGGSSSSTATATASAPATSSPSSLLTPALLERIALGTFTDSSAANLFMTYQRTVAVTAAAPSSATPTTTAATPERTSRVNQSAAPARVERFCSIRDLRDAFYRDASHFGDAFPVFAAARALITDLFADWQQQPRPSRTPSRPHTTTAAAAGPSPVKLEPDEHDMDSTTATHTTTMASAYRLETASSSRSARRLAPRAPFPRIALVFPRGNPTGNPLLVVRQFLHNLRQYFAPWMLYEVNLPCDSQQTAIPVLWHQRGGVLLLHCDEPSAQLGALHHEADVVIACGKAAAAWVAANALTSSAHPTTGTEAAMPLYFAALSEVEVVAEFTSHVWVPYEPVVDGAAALCAALVHNCPPAEDALGLKVAQGEAEKAWRQLQEVVGVLTSMESNNSSDVGRRRRRGASTVPSRAATTTTAIGGDHSSTPAHIPPRLAEEYAAIPKVIQQAVRLHQHLDLLAKGEGGDAEHAHGVWSAWVHSKAFTKSLALSAAATQPITLRDIQVGTA